MQLFCIICIAFCKWKYHVEEINQQHNGASFRLNNTIAGNPDAVNERQQPTSFILELRVNDLETNRKDGNRNVIAQRQPSLNCYPGFGNNVVYNKIIFEVYHMVFIVAAIILNLTSQYVNKSLNPVSMKDIPIIVLWLLDIGPAILLSVVLPFMIHLSYPEIRSYIKGCFYN